MENNNLTEFIRIFQSEENWYIQMLQKILQRGGRPLNVFPPNKILGVTLPKLRIWSRMEGMEPKVYSKSLLFNFSRLIFKLEWEFVWFLSLEMILSLRN